MRPRSDRIVHLSTRVTKQIMTLAKRVDISTRALYTEGIRQNIARKDFAMLAR
jgi:hypothetical protein